MKETQIVEFRGDCMGPFLKTGDHLLLARTKWGKIRLGDIVAFENKTSFPVLRVVGIEPEALVVKGDRSLTIARRVKRQKFFLRVEARRRSGTDLARESLFWQCAALGAVARWKLTRPLRRDRNGYEESKWI